MLLPVALFRVIVYLVNDILRCNTNNTNETLTIHKRFFVPKIKNTKKFSAFVIVIMNFSSKLEEKSSLVSLDGRSGNARLHQSY